MENISIENAKFEELLINCVQEYEHVWTISFLKHRDLQHVDNSWAEMAETLNESVKKRMTRWRSLRKSCQRNRSQAVLQEEKETLLGNGWEPWTFCAISSPSCHNNAKSVLHYSPRPTQPVNTRFLYSKSVLPNGFMMHVRSGNASSTRKT